jgi:tetratricopeptide (TPR) repeat protein
MINDKQKPKILQYDKTGWEFVYPKFWNPEMLHKATVEAYHLFDKKPKKAEEDLLSLIENYPYYFSAYSCLSELYRRQQKLDEALAIVEQGYLQGKALFPEKFNFSKHKLSWQILDNRAWLRICHAYGLECLWQKQFPKAIEIFRMILSLNEGDNQGIRLLLMDTYMNTGDYKAAREHLKKHQDDPSIEFRFGEIVLDVLEDKIADADRKLPVAMKRNKYVVDELAKEEHIPPPVDKTTEMLGGILQGSEQQAYLYWKSNKEVYAIPKVIEYFRSKKKQ